jgi:UDP:flavonoid glycosyltransferase YjiC (YdhE family)
MARYLFYLSPQTGHTFPLVPTVLELSARGHDVTVYCGPSEAATLSRLGLAVHRVDDAIVARAQDDWQATSLPDAYRRTMRTCLDRAPLEVADVNRAIGLHTPDVLVVDATSWGAGAAAQASGCPGRGPRPGPSPSNPATSRRPGSAWLPAGIRWDA